LFPNAATSTYALVTIGYRRIQRSAFSRSSCC
jgi:hypothetical protein